MQKMNWSVRNTVALTALSVAIGAWSLKASAENNGLAAWAGFTLLSALGFGAAAALGFTGFYAWHAAKQEYNRRAAAARRPAPETRPGQICDIKI